jgi:deoxyribodipyrimidine photolyase-related protein
VIRRATRLVLVLGDQLAIDSPVFDGFDATSDAVVMIEAAGEAQHVWSHKARIVLFVSAMRHFATELRARGWPVVYVAFDDAEYPEPELAQRLARVIASTGARALRLVEPGEWRVEQAIRAVAHSEHVALTVLDDPHFICSRGDFARWARGKVSLRLENFYRYLRARARAAGCARRTRRRPVELRRGQPRRISQVWPRRRARDCGVCAGRADTRGHGAG